jgi:ubiquinone/menaquinone biosynthesis C-methylase UbiE
MMVEAEIARHYTEGSLEQRIIVALKQAGKDPDRLDPDDLAPVDEFHHGGRAATTAFAPRLELKPGMRVLDMGSGLGGPARYLARQYGCRVTGIDLTEEFVSVARGLTRRLAMDDKVEFDHGSALAMPYAASSFDAATLFHVGMNIADKRALFTEVRRVLKPGGVFGIYDQMRAGEGQLAYPVPWASHPAHSFVDTPETYKRYLAEAGFAIVWERSCAEDALASFTRQTSGDGDSELPPLGVHVALGSDAARKTANHRQNLGARLVAPYEIVAQARS